VNHELLQSEQQSGCSRRQFLGGAVSAAAAAPLLAAGASFAAEDPAPEKKPKTPKRKIKLGLVGCGGRGSWIIQFFLKHGGYDLHAIADYFQPVADALGDKRGVDRRRRFSGLSGYKRVIESGVEAVALIVPPCFLPEHSAAAAAAGLHVYMAKPVAPDVPGCLTVEAAGKQATEKQRVFLVDYQLPTDPGNIQVAELIRGGGIGKLAKLITVGINGGRDDPPKGPTIENLLHKSSWNYWTALSGGFSVSYDVHAIDAAVWLVGRRPVAAMGGSRICRPNPHGDSADATSTVFEYEDGLIHEHSGMALPTGVHDELSCRIFGQTGQGALVYWSDAADPRPDRKARFAPRGKKGVVCDVLDLYRAGAVRNIASFYDDVMAGRCENPTVRRAVDGCLTCILGREAAVRHGRLTMDELLKENRRLEVDLTGLKV
jgi:myo-inositol 2-dehydrogenase / D-chiro-inositol 1-dehydrogenase